MGAGTGLEAMQTQSWGGRHSSPTPVGLGALVGHTHGAGTGEHRAWERWGRTCGGCGTQIRAWGCGLGGEIPLRGHSAVPGCSARECSALGRDFAAWSCPIFMTNPNFPSKLVFLLFTFHVCDHHQAPNPPQFKLSETKEFCGYLRGSNYKEQN